MHYPGYIPHTLYDDGAPVDVLVVTPVPLITVEPSRSASVDGNLSPSELALTISLTISAYVCFGG